MNLKLPPSTFGMQLQAEQISKLFCWANSTFHLLLRQWNLMKGGKNGNQSVKRSQALVLKLNEAGDTVRLRAICSPGAATVALTAQGKDSTTPGSRGDGHLSKVWWSLTF